MSHSTAAHHIAPCAHARAGTPASSWRANARGRRSPRNENGKFLQLPRRGVQLRSPDGPVVPSQPRRQATTPANHHDPD
eukprot:8610873-Pyramimonas_sp.AAC.1